MRGTKFHNSYRKYATIWPTYHQVPKSDTCTRIFVRNWLDDVERFM